MREGQGGRRNKRRVGGNVRGREREGGQEKGDGGATIA